VFRLLTVCAKTSVSFGSPLLLSNKFYAFLWHFYISLPFILVGVRAFALSLLLYCFFVTYYSCFVCLVFCFCVFALFLCFIYLFVLALFSAFTLLRPKFNKYPLNWIGLNLRHTHTHTHIYIYRVIQEESALLWEMIVWVILSKNVHTNMGPFLSGYEVMGIF